MTTKKTSRRALFTSIMALVMCLVMLVGTTFAWFTDSVTSGVNTIKSGNLDVELEYKNTKDGSFTKVDENTNVFKTGTLWEPGHVEYAVLRISNVGSLALKYQLGVKVAKETTSTSVLGNELKLSNYLKFAVLDGDKCDLDRDTMVETAATSGAQLLSTGYAKEDSINAGAEAKLVTLVVWMPTTVGNEANYAKDAAQPTIDLGISLTATQEQHEKDSFDETYDAGATLPTVVSGQNDLSSAIAADKKNLSLAEGNYTLYNVNNSKTQNTSLTIEGAGADKTTFNVGKPVADQPGEYNADYSYENSDVVFKNMTVNVGTGDYKGIVRAKSLYFENCTIVGRGSYWGSGKVVFKNCTFASNDGDYNIWTYSGTEFVFDSCVFNSDSGKFVNAYKEQRVDTKLDFTNCKFEGSNTGKDAVCLKKYTDLIWTVNFTNCTAPSGKQLWWAESGLNAASTVTVDGTVVWANGAQQ